MSELPPNDLDKPIQHYVLHAETGHLGAKGASLGEPEPSPETLGADSNGHVQ